MLQFSIKLTETGGYAQRNMQVEQPLEFPRGQLLNLHHIRVTDVQGQETVFQADHSAYWQDGSIKSFLLTFQANVPPKSSAVYHIDCKAAVKSTLPAPHPVSIEDKGHYFEAVMGATLYQVRKDRFNFVNQVIFNGVRFFKEKTRGSSIKLKTGEELFLDENPHFMIGRKGPLKADLLVKGSYGKGRFGFETKITFVSRKSWLEILHRVDKTYELESIIIESPFALGDKPVSAQFGSRLESSGRALGWSVITSENTADTTVGEMRSPQGLVRFEIAPDGNQSVIFPPLEKGVEVWYHYLIGPPNDAVNTPAGTMVSRLQAQLQSHS